jgi:hypothetical protein
MDRISKKKTKKKCNLLEYAVMKNCIQQSSIQQNHQRCFIEALIKENRELKEIISKKKKKEEAICILKDTIKIEN